MSEAKSGVVVLHIRNPDCAALHPGYKFPLSAR